MWLGYIMGLSTLGELRRPQWGACSFRSRGPYLIFLDCYPCYLRVFTLRFVLGMTMAHNFQVRMRFESRVTTRTFVKILWNCFSWMILVLDRETNIVPSMVDPWAVVGLKCVTGIRVRKNILRNSRASYKSIELLRYSDTIKIIYVADLIDRS